MGDHGKRDTDPDLTIHIMATRKFTVYDVLGMCYDSDFTLSENKSSCNEGGKVYAFFGQRVIQPVEVALFSELSFLTRLVAQLA